MTRVRGQFPQTRRVTGVRGQFPQARRVTGARGALCQVGRGRPVQPSRTHTGSERLTWAGGKEKAQEKARPGVLEKSH